MLNFLVGNPSIEGPTQGVRGFPKIGVPRWRAYYKGILLFGVYFRGPLFSVLPQGYPFYIPIG